MDDSGSAEAQFDRTTVEGRLAEMAYLDGLTDEELAGTDPGHRYVTRNPSETPAERAVLLRRLAEAEARLQLPALRDIEAGRYSADDFIVAKASEADPNVVMPVAL